MTLSVNDDFAASRIALSEKSAQDPDMAKVIEERRMMKIADQNKASKSLDSVSSGGGVRDQVSQRVAEQDSDTINHSYVALLHKVSKLEAEKSDLQMQVESDATAYRDVYKVAQELEEDTAEIEKNQLKIAEPKVKGSLANVIEERRMINVTGKHAAGNFKPFDSFFPGTARGQVSQHAVEHDSESITRSYLEVSRGISTEMSHMTDMCVRQYTVVVAGPGRGKSQHLVSSQGESHAQARACNCSLDWQAIRIRPQMALETFTDLPTQCACQRPRPQRFFASL